MELFNIIYLIIPFVAYSLQAVILTKFSRTKWSLSMSFYRQFTIFLIGLPLLYFYPIDLKILQEYIFIILFTSLIWAMYLFISFKSYDYIQVALWNSFSLVSRILLTILTWIFLLSESLNIYQYIWIFFLFISISLLFKIKEKLSFLWVFLSIISWALLVANWYYFILYSKSFSPILAGYLLEVFNGVFLFLFLIIQSFSQKKPFKKTFSIDSKTFSIILSSAPLALLWTAAISKSYELYSFTIVWIALTMILPASLIFSRIILKERPATKTIFIIIAITASVVGIKYFG